MTTQSIDLLTLSPPLVVAGGALLALLADLLTRRVAVVVGIGLVALLLAAVLSVVEQGSTLCAAHGVCAYDTTTPIAVPLQLVALGGTLLVLLMATPDLYDRRVPTGEFAFLLLASASGAALVPATTDLVSLIVAIEVVSLPTFALVALHRRQPRSAEAALKIFLFSVSSVAVSLYGIALLYGTTGVVTFEALHQASSATEPTPLAAAGLVMVLAVLAFKVAAVPFHAWAPDAYQGATVPVAAYLSVVSKTAGFAGFLLIGSTFRDWSQVWAPVVAVLAVVSIVIGNVVALRQRDAVRLLAWSSIAQAGYVLVPLGAMIGSVAWGPVVWDATIAYVAAYAAMNLAAFAVVAVVARRAGLASLAEYRGLAWRSPWLAVSLALALAALAGLPPGLIGLFVKVRVLAVAVDGEAWWLVAAVVVGTVIGLAYYLSWAAQLFRRPEAEVERLDVASWPARIAVATTLALVAVLSVAPSLALGLAEDVHFEASD